MENFSLESLEWSFTRQHTRSRGRIRECRTSSAATCGSCLVTTILYLVITSAHSTDIAINLCSAIQHLWLTQQYKETPHIMTLGIWNVFGNNNTILGNNKPLGSKLLALYRGRQQRHTHSHAAAGPGCRRWRNSFPPQVPTPRAPSHLGFGGIGVVLPGFWSGVHSDLDFFQAGRERGVRARPWSQSLKADTEDWGRICDLPSPPDQVITLSM